MKKLKEGDIIKLEAGHRVYADIPKHFVYTNKRGSFELTHSDIQLGGEFDYLCGEYVVYKTAMDGGGTGHGPHDIYPDGWHVWCERLTDRVKVDFYQSGCFTAMITDIEPVGQAERNWTH